MRDKLVIGLIGFPFVVGQSEKPNCEKTSFAIVNARPVSIFLPDFIEAGAIAEYCSDNSCDSASSFRTGSATDCAIICSKTHACEWWTAEQITVSQHINTSVCHLFNSDNSSSVNGVVRSNTTSGHRTCNTSVWPQCIEEGTFISGAGYSELWINATALLNLPKLDTSCSQGNCDKTDTFRVHSKTECAFICSQFDACKHWSTTENSQFISCWLHQIANK